MLSVYRSVIDDCERKLHPRGAVLNITKAGTITSRTTFKKIDQLNFRLKYREAQLLK